MSVYCIYLGKEIYYGSTTKKLCQRKACHNLRLREGLIKNKLYEKARELGINYLDLQLLYQGEDYKEMEHEFIINSNCLNMNGAIYDRGRALQKHRDAQRRYIIKKKLKNYNLS